MGAKDLILAAAMAACTPALGAGSHEVSVCVDYGCDETVNVTLDPSDVRALQPLFSTVGDAADERRAVARAIGRLERIVGARAGTAEDAPRNSDQWGRTGQLDCISESTNTHLYLEILRDEGLLRFHRVSGREVRRRWLFSAHWTAILEEIETGDSWAIDSWHGANGDPAVIQPIAAWRRAEPAPDERH